jgi:hypothetical protein
MKITLDVDVLKYIDSILYQCGKKSTVLGIHNDGEKTIFFISPEQLRLDFLNDIRIGIKSNCEEKFTIGLEFEIFRKLLTKTGTIEFDVSDTHVSVVTSNSKHKFKIVDTRYLDQSNVSGDGYELFTTNLAMPISCCFEPDYDSRMTGVFENDINIVFVGDKIIATTTNRSVITRFHERVTGKSFTGDDISLPANSMNFILSTMRDINLFKLFITESFIRIVLFDAKHETTLKYDLKLSSAKFPNCDKFFIHGDDTFSIDCQLFKDFINNFVSIRNQDCKEIISLRLNSDMLQCSLIHTEHESFSELKVDPIRPNDATLYFDMELLKSTIKNIPKGTKLLVCLFETRTFIFSEDKKFQGIVSGVDPSGMTGRKPNDTSESD